MPGRTNGHEHPDCAPARGALCGRTARRDLRGGRRATDVPTLIDKNMPEELLEIQRCSHSEAAEQTTSILKEAGIRFRLASTTGNFDLTSIGTGQGGEVIISVAKQDHRAAIAALEQALLEIELPDNHFLHDASDEELVEVVGQASEWSPFDVAH